MKNKVLVFFAVVAATLGFGTAAFAAPPTIPADPTGGAMGDVQAAAQTWVLTYGVPVLFALLILGVLIKLAVKWARRGAASI